ncbi:MAG: class I SAM-dependent methyltransferase [Planctomycetes bacterium]|nr:class I SAM-dependent methyltransferase [Planctomycetota bacterium]
MEAAEYDRNYALERDYWFFRGMRRILHALAARWTRAPEGRPARILDVGCGTGILLGELAPRGRTVGADRSPLALGYCRLRGHRELVRCDAGALPFRARCFDLVVANGLIEHLDEDAGFAAELARVLAPGGRALVVTSAGPGLWTDHDRANHHRRRYRRSELEAVLRSGGLELLQLSFVNLAILPAVWAVARLEALRRPGRRVPRRKLPRVPPVVNAVLYALLAAESWLLRRSNLPFGVSLVAVAGAREGA